MPDILDNEQLLNSLERILAFSEGFLGSFIPRVPLACLKYREWIFMTNPPRSAQRCAHSGPQSMSMD